MKYNRRTSRPLENLPSLFGEEELGMPGDVKTESAAVGKEPVKDDDMILSDEVKRPGKRLRFISFGSGSSGNCSYVGTQESGILIDAGVDNHRVINELEKNGIKPSSIKGILLTHDHGDHVRYVYALVRRQPGWRIFSTPRTLEGILRRHCISRRIRDYHSPIYKEHQYSFGDLLVTPFETSHDGSDNVGYAITMDKTTFVIATDTGIITERADFYLRRATAIMIESNYDLQMLVHGKYAEHLKARIRSAIGHMDNAETSRYITDIYTPALTHIFLCHLSDDNNTPETAMVTMLNSLRTIGINPALSAASILPGTVYIEALPRYKSTDLFIL